jgi:hypothetical protein
MAQTEEGSSDLTGEQEDGGVDEMQGGGSPFIGTASWVRTGWCMHTRR